MRLRIGLAGVGAGALNILPGFAHSPIVELAAAADLREEALAGVAREFGARTYRTVEALCQDDGVDAIWVATPNHLHAEHTIMALEHGKHVIVSKPMAVPLEECEAKNQAAERNGRVLVAGHSQAMAAPIRRMAELARRGDYGRLFMVHTWHYTDWVYRPRLAAELDEPQGGGVVFRQSPHQIDIVRLIGGGVVKSVRATTYDLDPKRPTTGAYTAFLELEGGAAATLVYSGYGRFSAAELTFGEGRGPTAQGDDKDSLRYRGQPIEQATRHPFFGLTIASLERADIRQSPQGLYVHTHDGRQEIELPVEEQRGEAEFQELYDAVRHGRPAIHSGRWGQATHEVTLAIRQSAREGREVQLSQQARIPEGA